MNMERSSMSVTAVTDIAWGPCYDRPTFAATLTVTIVDLETDLDRDGGSETSLTRAATLDRQRCLGRGARHVAELPSGPVTFLVTDIVGSSQLWERAEQAMSLAMVRHDGILRG